MKKHGYRKTRLYNVWGLMKNRCFCKTSDHYNLYGKRGIIVCDEWKNDFVKFHEWAIKNGYDENAPQGQCTLDRIDVNGNYEPNNCRWVNMKTQGNNTRYNIRIKYNNEEKTITEWADELGLQRETIVQRYKRGLPIKDVLYNDYLRNKKIKTILQIDENNNVVKEWNCSATQIGKNKEFCARNILYCLKGQAQTHKGYKWRYKDDISN